MIDAARGLSSFFRCMPALLLGIFPFTVNACELEPLGAGTVRAVLDGRTLLLEDGREVRLAGIEVPPMPRPGAAGDAAASDSAALSARAALEALARGKPVTLKRLGAVSDRYGRVVAFATVSRDGAELSLQTAMLAQGQARVAARVEDKACADALLAGERSARESKLGLWANSYYAILSAENPTRLRAARGRFAVVEGKILSVRDSGGTIYMNFGRRWIEGFAVTILKRNKRLFKAAGIEPKKLEGKTVRVRGWIEEHGGPRLEAARPEQIEVTGKSLSES
jgi:endonuclease YncB( thermonuclease family)